MENIWDYKGRLGWVGRYFLKLEELGFYFGVRFVFGKGRFGGWVI